MEGSPPYLLHSRFPLMPRCEMPWCKEFATHGIMPTFSQSVFARLPGNPPRLACGEHAWALVPGPAGEVARAIYEGRTGSGGA